MQPKKKGFTLVELSIVLVIIGLLIGGILAGQSMIETARVNSFVRQIQQYDVAVANFQTKYNSLPGDSVAFGCTVPNGSASMCGDGLIDSYVGTSATFEVEIANFWPQLQDGGFNYAKPFSTTFASGFNGDDNNPNTPTVTGSVPGVIIAANCKMTVAAGNNCWEIANAKGSNDPLGNLSSGTVKGAFTTEIALAIDTKIDDGKAEAGNIRNWYKQSQPSSTGIPAIDNCTAAGSSYRLDYSGAVLCFKYRHVKPSRPNPIT